MRDLSIVDGILNLNRFPSHYFDARVTCIHSGIPILTLTPVYAKVIAQAIADGLSKAFPIGEKHFQANVQKFHTHLDQKLIEWKQLAEPLRGVKFVSYHQDTIYFAERFGLLEVGQIEIKPGIEPTQAHLVWLVERMKEQQVGMVCANLITLNGFQIG